MGRGTSLDHLAIEVGRAADQFSLEHDEESSAKRSVVPEKETVEPVCEAAGSAFFVILPDRVENAVPKLHHLIFDWH